MDFIYIVASTIHVDVDVDVYVHLDVHVDALNLTVVRIVRWGGSGSYVI